MIGYWMTPDDESPGVGGYFPGGHTDHPDDRPAGPKPGPVPAPHPTPELVNSGPMRALALSQTSDYLLSQNVLDPGYLSNHDVQAWFDEQMERWNDVPEYESLIKPYQLWAGGVLRAGPTKFIPLFIAWVPATSRVLIGAKQSVSATTNNLSTGFSGAACWGLELGVSPAQNDGHSSGTDQTYNLNLGYCVMTYIPDKSFSVRIEACLPPSSNFGVSTGVSASRGFSQTISKPRQTPWPSPTPGNLNDGKLR